MSHRLASIMAGSLSVIAFSVFPVRAWSSGELPGYAIHEIARALPSWMPLNRTINVKPVGFELRGKIAKKFGPDSYLADMVLGGIKPNPYEYFLIRSPESPSEHLFDFVFFSQDGSRYVVGIPIRDVSQADESAVAFSITLKGGGEAGTVRTDRTFIISRSGGPSSGKALAVTIDEKSFYSSLWTKDRQESGTAILTFREVSPATGAIGRQ